MALLFKIESLCEELTSNKITDRKKASSNFLQTVRTDETVKNCNQNGKKYWTLLISSVHKYLLKEADKAFEDKRKKGTFSQPNGSLFCEIVKLTISEGRDYSVDTIVSCISQCLESDTLSQFCIIHYLNALQSIMLPNEYIRSHIEISDWNVIYKRIKNRYKNDAESNGNISKDLLNSLSHYIKYGPLHGFSIELLREQFPFISQLCNSVNINSTRPIQIAIVEIMYHFTLHTAKDSRSSCCKLGEDSFHSLIGLYEIQNPRNDGMKLKLVKYLLLQFSLHHPRSIPEGHSGAYAYSWEKWNQCMKSIYRKCYEDITHCSKFHSHCANTMPICSKKEIKYLQKDFARLFAESIRHMEMTQSRSEQGSFEERDRTKKLKMESPITDLITSIEMSQKWPWLNVMCMLLKIQSDILNTSQFSSLLQILSKLQVECKDSSLAHHIYNCLVLLENIQSSLGLGENPEIQNTWSIIRDTALRTFGLNQNDPSLHNLLQRLVIGAYNISSENIIQTYISEVLDVTEHNLTTLATTFDRLNFSQTRTQNELLIKWILSKNTVEDYNYLSKNITAKILVGLVANKWPTSIQEREVNEMKSEEQPFKEIADIYLKLGFETSLTSHENEKQLNIVENKLRKVTLQDALCIFLKNSLKTLVKSSDSCNSIKKLKHYLNITALIKNILNYLLDFQLIEETGLDQNILLEIMVSLLDKINDTLSICFNDKNFDDVIISTLNECMICFCEIFSDSSSSYLDEKIRRIITTDLLKTFFTLLLEQDREKKVDFKELRTPLLNLRKNVIKVLVMFSCGLRKFATPNQKFVFDALVKLEYGVDEYSNCDLPFIFLESTAKSKIEDLGEQRIAAVLMLLYNLCTTRYRYYSCAKNILEFIHYFSTNVANDGSKQSKDDMMDMLFPFYMEHKRYGPAYSVILVNCIGKLYEIDTNHDFAKWSGSEVVLKLPEFLCNDYLEVRFAAIQNIIRFFEVSSSRKKIEDIHLQEIVFQNICDKSDKIFEVEGNLTNERQIDEIVSRSASALHVLSSIVITSHQWRENALFVLFKIIYKRRLDCFPKVLKMISQYLNLKNESVLLEKYSNGILRRWLNEDLGLDDFLFSLFGCDNMKDFYEKNMNEILPYLIENRKELSIVESTGKTLTVILEECFSTLCVRGLVSNIAEFSQIDFENNNLFICLMEHCGRQEFLLNFAAKIDEILYNLLSAVKDQDDISKKFDILLILPKSVEQNITLRDFCEVIDVIKDKVCHGQPLVLHLLTEKVNKLQNIMMKLNIKIHNSLALNDKLLAFHQYTILNDMCMQYFSSSDAREYFIRDICYVLIRIIKNNSEFLELRASAVKYFKTCLDTLITFPEIMRKSFIPIVTIFINIIIDGKNDLLTDLTLDLVKYLINDHIGIFEDIIKCMDNLPEHHLLLELSEVQSKLKKVDDEISLKKEIQNFVDNGYTNKDCSSKIDTLKNLKMYLFTLKRQLKNLYRDLSKLNGFSEDCENSLLHQMVSLLVDLCLSKDKGVSMEALKCLGELGPSDLMTLIVKPEKQLFFENSTPQEFFTGQVISLLNMYLIDDNIQLICPSMEILFSALNTSEGRKALESGNDYGYGPLPNEYFTPFLIGKKPKSFIPSLKKSMDQLLSQIDLNHLWCPEESVEYDEWIKNLLCKILQTISDCYIPKLIPICELKIAFCEALLPSLVYLLVSLNNNINTIITKKINKFFEGHWTAIMTNNKQNLIVLNKKAVKVMLSVVHFVRVNRSNLKQETAEDFDLDYLKIAKAAQYCSAYFTSLLYTEIWCHSKVETIDSYSFKSSILDLIHESDEGELSLAVLNILRSSYKAIGDEDSLQGCGTSLLLNPQLRIEHFKDVGMWDQAILYQNLQISRDVPTSKDMLIDSLKHCGLYETSLMCNDSLIAPDYECMWRLGKWTLPEMRKSVDKKKVSFNHEMEKYKYLILKAVHERDVFSVMEHIESARLSVVGKLKHTSLESSSNLYGILAYLQSFNEIEEFLNASSNTEDLNIVIKKWHHQDEIDKRFIYVEPIITQRMIILSDFLQEFEDVTFYKDHLIDFALKLSEKARLENINHFGIRALNFVRNLPKLTENEENRIFLEDAQLCWESNNKLIGRRILDKIAGNEEINPKLKSEALKLVGKWSAESYSEHANTIIENYLEPSLVLMKDSDKTKDEWKSIYDTYDTLGKFADRQYQQVTAHIASDVFQKKIENLHKSNETIKNLRKATTPEERIAKIFHEKQSSIDHTEIENTKKEKDYFLHIALKYYMKNLACSDNCHLQIFRVMALFLENRTCASIKELIERYIPKIPTYKFLTILPQLIPHIAIKNTGDMFSLKANEIIDRCAREHPHHTLPIILALANSLKDSDYSKIKTKVSINEDRVAEAKKIIKSLKNDPVLKGIIIGLEIVSDALVELAYMASKEKSRKCEIPKRSKIASIKNFPTVAVLTHNLQIRKNGKYDDIVGIYSYETQYSLVGGKNAPKKIKCIGTDGNPYEQLVKGQDDLRQDAVMQQVFTIMNSLLSANKHSYGLKIRTYKIVPLSMRSGVLEWAKNTMPVSAYLTGDGEIEGAHQRYRPQDKRPSTCRVEINDAAKTSAENRLKVFNKICKNFKPVFHKFFEENFLHPAVWYERRRAFIHSAATTSMVGYILGIGDRHVSNILIDKTTAELVHIDFGIAFEQGRTLPTPETVPFRLTRDFVDAMGVSGVEGAFKKSCEKTMTIMKDNYQTIMAILEVLLYDPLYSWTVSVAEANKRQRDPLDDTTHFRTSPQSCEADFSVNTTAQRALMRLKAKLLGIEEGTPMSVEHQVAALVHQAMDPANLSKLYCGWQAYL
ncbi:serine-protein kinase ATM isoform X2 [Coccinella septempunctata]|uniref:serine-protein kinase ATM isoform X2 n=1 Tax=Coccinella septempunctata TaxID=41139 RepID=UPI001D094785|nr:serine-protein kinase ATM isoform X2 [Coccinella septempunctata]